MASAGWMCSSMNALTRSPISTALALGGGRVGMAIDCSLTFLWLARSGLRGVLRLRSPNNPAHAGERREMMVGVAEHLIDHGDALEIVTDLVLHRHADAAMHLDRRL